MAGVFPYLETGELLDRSGDVLIGELPVTIEEGGQFASSSGESYDASGWAPATTLAGVNAAAVLVGTSNRRLVVGERRWTVIACTHQRITGQLELNLLRNQAA